MNFFVMITRISVYTSMRHKVGDTRKRPNSGSSSSNPNIPRSVLLVVAEGDSPDGDALD
jgi:hypothetical protein